MIRIGIIDRGFIAHEHIKVSRDINDYFIYAIDNRTL
jgi:hypothetical protein